MFSHYGSNLYPLEQFRELQQADWQEKAELALRKDKEDLDPAFMELPVRWRVRN